VPVRCFASLAEAKQALLRQRSVSCYNCGAIGHLGMDCGIPSWSEQHTDRTGPGRHRQKRQRTHGW
jgi:hypothetical protein